MRFHCVLFVASHGLAAVSFTHRAVSQGAFVGNVWALIWNFKTRLDSSLTPGSHRALSHNWWLSHANVHSPPPPPLRLQSSGPFLSCCVLCVAESQGTWSASPLHADLQPLICGPHEGVTSLKDVVGLSTFEPDVVFGILKSADGGFLGLFSSCSGNSPCGRLLHSSFTLPVGSGPLPGGIFNRRWSVLEVF